MDNESITSNRLSRITLWIIVVVIFLAAVGVAGVIWFKQHQNNPVKNPLPEYRAQNNETTQASPIPATSTSSANSIAKVSDNSESGVLPKQPAKSPEVEKPTNGEIVWHYPIKGHLGLIKTNDHEAEYLEVGQFRSGKYQNNYFFIALVPDCEDMGCGIATLRIVADTNLPNQQKRMIVLKRYSDPLDNIDSSVTDIGKLIIDADTKISDLEFPDTIAGPGASQELVLAERGFFQGSYSLFNANDMKFVFNSSEVGSVYEESRGGFDVKLPDWSTVTYKMTPNFIRQDGIPKVVWNEGSVNTKQYVYTDRTGCGGSNYASVVSGDQVNVQNDLVRNGATTYGDAVYELKDRNNKILKDIYNNFYYTYDNQPKMPYDQFVTTHPIFFWVDPFGRLIKFTNNDFQPQTECAKPAIYLYPTHTSNINVKIYPQGGFITTDPAYGSGWDVIADPDGTIHAGGKAYPYLFWEGRGGLYKTPDKGFVVEKKDIRSFLLITLAKLGLNQKESVDFMEYWEPHFTSAPYYFITFMGNNVMDEIAPLAIDPKPDTVVRVLMDFKPLAHSMQVQGYNIKTPERKGFTVIEWGGVKHQ